MTFTFRHRGGGASAARQACLVLRGPVPLSVLEDLVACFQVWEGVIHCTAVTLKIPEHEFSSRGDFVPRDTLGTVLAVRVRARDAAQRPPGPRTPPRQLGPRRQQPRGGRCRPAGLGRSCGPCGWEERRLCPQVPCWPQAPSLTSPHLPEAQASPFVRIVASRTLSSLR